MKERIEQLDSMRGLAAVSVFLYHILCVDHEWPYLLSKLLTWTPLKVFSNGNNAVMFFFVLSGFVLSIPFLKSTKVIYTPYFIKRIFRIYIPYLFAIIIAITLSQFPSTNGIIDLNNWEKWTTPLTLNLFVEHLFLIGNIHTEAFNEVIWSLVHELRISFVFPFVILFLVKRLNWKYTLCICLLLSSIGFLNEVLQIQKSNGHGSSYFNSIHYLAIFIIGSLLAKHRSELINFYRGLNQSLKWMILIISFVLYSYSDLVLPIILTKIPLVSSYQLIFKEYGTVLGASGFIILALGSIKLSKLLNAKPFLFLGKISYSLYLYHLIVLFSCIYLFYGSLPLVTIFVLSVPITILISYFMWLLVEYPSMNFGKKLAAKTSGYFRESRNIRIKKDKKTTIF